MHQRAIQIEHPARLNAERLRVAMLARVVYPLHGFGGIERHVFHLTTHLARLGVAVTLYVQPAPGTPATVESLREALPGLERVILLQYDHTSPILRPNSILGRQINYPIYTWRLGKRVALAVRNGSYDIVHAQGLCAFGYGWLRSRDPQLQAVPFIANPHGLEEYRTQSKLKWLAYAPFRQLYSYGTRSADRAIATDACTQDDLPHYLGVNPGRVVVIPSAIDVAECLTPVNALARQAVRTQLGLQPGLNILSVSRLERNKGYHILAEALARIQQQLPQQWRWLLVGEGKERAALERQVAALGIAAHVTFVGRLDDATLHNLYEEIDLMIHPTLYEGSSLVTLEAMIHRRPIIASAAGGIPDKVFNQRNGLLVQPGDTNQLAAAILNAIQQRNHWQQWGKQSEQIVRSTFDWPVVARRTKQEYLAMLGYA
jgi:glycogen synthase